MKNFVQPGNTIPVTLTATVSSGDVIEVGGFIGVVAVDGESGDRVELSVVGVYELPKNNADAFTEGQLAYWDSGAGEVVDTDGGGANTLLGAATEAKAAAATLLRVRLNGTAK